MADIRVKLDESRVPVRPKSLLPAVTAYCRELFPSDTQVTCNDTRVQADFELGEDVNAHAVIDVDPAHDDPEVTRVSGWFNVSGRGLRESDQAEIEKMAAQIFDGLRATIESRIRELRAFDGFDTGLG